MGRALADGMIWYFSNKPKLCFCGLLSGGAVNFCHFDEGFRVVNIAIKLVQGVHFQRCTPLMDVELCG